MPSALILEEMNIGSSAVVATTKQASISSADEGGGMPGFI
jgi:hypothetical protein